MMHERIHELAEQAGFYFYDMHNVDGQDLGESVEADSFSVVDKFAEFIVMECVNVLDQQGLWNIEMSNILAKHFGVGYGHNSN